MGNTLVLSVKKKWFDLIKSGQKTEEYRELNEYWKKRFGFKQGYYKGYKYVEFRNGYGLGVPKFKIELLEIVITSPNPKFEENKDFDIQTCFVLRLGRLLPCA